MGWEPGLSSHPPACAADCPSAPSWLRSQPWLPGPGPGPGLTIAHHGGKGPHQLQQNGGPHSRPGCPRAPRIPLGPNDNVVICGGRCVESPAYPGSTRRLLPAPWDDRCSQGLTISQAPSSSISASQISATPAVITASAPPLWPCLGGLLL